MQQHATYLTRHAVQRSQKRALNQEALRAATMFGDRFVLDDGTVMHIVTRRAAARIVEVLGLRAGYVDDALRGTYVVIKRSGAVVTCGRRWKGEGGRLRRS